MCAQTLSKINCIGTLSIISQCGHINHFLLYLYLFYAPIVPCRKNIYPGDGNAILKIILFHLFNMQVVSYRLIHNGMLCLNRPNHVTWKCAEGQNDRLLMSHKKSWEKTLALRTWGRVINEKLALHRGKMIIKTVQISHWESKHAATTWLRFISLIWVVLHWRTELSRFDGVQQRSACWGLTGMVKPINELYCILSSPTSLGMHVCMLNIWICIGIEHLLSELAVS